MAKAKKLPSGNWRVRASYTDENGVKHTVSITEKTERLANAKAAAWQAKIIEDVRQERRMTLQKAAEEYIETCRCAGMSPSTIAGYIKCLRNAYPQLVGKDVGRITLQDVQRQVNARSKDVAPKTIRNEVGFLSIVLKQNGVKLDFTMLRLPKRTAKEMTVPDDGGVMRLFRAVEADDNVYIAVLLASIMGLRRSEICALKWGDIDWQRSTLRIDKAVVLDEHGNACQKTPKTQAGYRTLCIPSSLLPILQRFRGLPSASLISCSPSALSAKYRRMLEANKISCRFHDLRHYHASVMIREGVPEKYIVADMGHSSYEMVRRVYGHVMGEKQEEINAAMATHAEKVLALP